MIAGFNRALIVLACIGAVEPSFAQASPPRISERVQAHLERAAQCYEREDFDCARAALANILRRQATNAELTAHWNRLAYVEFLDGNLTEAAAAYRHVADLSTHRGQREEALRSYAQLNASVGRFREAYEALEEFLVRDGHTPLASRHLTADGLWRGYEVYIVGTWDPVPLVPEPATVPEQAAAAGIEAGYAVVDLTVTRTGMARGVSVVEASSPLLEAAALEAGRGLRFKPGIVDGVAVETTGVRQRVEFGAARASR